MVSGLEVAHARADGLDHPGRLVAEDERHGERHPVAGQCVEVTVADTGGRDPDEDLTDPGLVDLDVFDGRGTRHRVEDCRAHAGSIARLS